MLKGSVREGLALKICHEIKQRLDVRIRLAVSVILAYGSQVRSSKRLKALFQKHLFEFMDMSTVFCFYGDRDPNLPDGRFTAKSMMMYLKHICA